ncbi:hypothetical protein LguiB_005463 [Lonicera macranthoides]
MAIKAQSTAPTMEKRKLVFTKFDNLKPGTYGHTLTMKVVSSKPVVQKAGGWPAGEPECLPAPNHRVYRRR